MSIRIRSIMNRLRTAGIRSARLFAAAPRAMQLALAGIVVCSLLIAGLGRVLLERQYRLSPEALQLLGSVNSSLAGKFTYDTQKEQWVFNKDGMAGNQTIGPDGVNLKTLKARAGGTGRDSDSLYSVTLPTDLHQSGITYYDNNLGVSFSLLPQFKTGTGEEHNGRVIYPLADGGQLVYTAKSNGMQEDIILQHAGQDSRSFSYTLNLPATLAAKPMADGSIGIYSADPVLYGNLSYGSAADEQKVMEAREKSAKTNLVFVLPTPAIKQSSGQGTDALSGRFTLHSGTLGVVAMQLRGLKYPISIDPSVVVTSTSDFQTNGNNEDNINYATADQISRGQLTGGTLSGGWTGTSSFTTAREDFAVAVYNGYIYLLGGDNGSSYFNDVQYAPINANGTIGSWTSTTSFTTARAELTAIVYSGYIYIMGGQSNVASGDCTAAGDMCNGIQYAPINANGTIGSWTSTTSFTTARAEQGSVVYNGYVYILGGATNGVVLNDVQYAPINANGTIGSWTSTTSFTTARWGAATFAYNGYIYLLGGNNFNVSTLYNDVQYAPINANGTLGPWSTTASLPTGLGIPNAGGVYGGYAYVFGGYNGGTSNTVYYAPINANGTLGPWHATTSFTTARTDHCAILYGGYAYVLGGFNGVSTYFSTTQYAQVDPAGVTGSYTTSPNNFIVARANMGVTVYNGYMYMVGGYADSSAGDCTATGFDCFGVQYAPINSDGSIGAWHYTHNSTDDGTTFVSGITTARNDFGFAAYNGYLYVIGGSTNEGSSQLKTGQYAPLNSNGTVGTWSTATTLPSGADGDGVSAVAYNGKMYVLGGFDDSAFGTNAVFYATINSNGSLGSWTQNSTSFTTNRAYFGAVAYSGYMYVLGGFTGGSIVNTVYYAPINANGTIGSWTQANSFTGIRAYFNAFAYNGKLYIAGGTSNGNTVLKDVQYADINSNGSLGSWKATVNLNSPGRVALRSVGYNGYLYAVGGWDGTSSLNSTIYAPINNGGSGVMPSWTTSGSTFTTARSELAAVAYNGFLYTIGGNNTSNVALTSVQYAPLNTNGTIGSWSAATSLPSGLRDLGVAVYNGYLYTIGGNDNTSATGCSAVGNGTFDCTIVNYAPINANGTLGSWASTTSIADPTDSLGATAYNGHIYAFGGYDVTAAGYVATVQYATINANGTLGSWASTTSFSGARGNFGSVVYNGYLYILGGYDFGTLNDVQFAAINADGTLGTWTTTTWLPSAGLSDLSAVAVDGFIYAVGGDDGTNALATTLYAPINANGTLGSWTPTATMAHAREAFGLAAYNGMVYAVGGYDNTSERNDAEYTYANAMARVAHYSRQFSLGLIGQLTGITYAGTLPSGISSFTYRIAGADGAYGSTANASTISASTGQCPTGSNAGRYIWVELTLDDSSSGSFPDINGSDANVTDFTVNYYAGHAPANQRLRTGAWFSNNALTPLDTCGP